MISGLVRLSQSKENSIVVALILIALERQIQNLKDKTVSDSERAKRVNQTLAVIARLSKEVKDASSYVPSYDQRLYSEV